MLLARSLFANVLREAYMSNDILNIVQKVFFLSPDEVVTDSKDSRRILINALNTLSGREVVAIFLRNVCGMTYKQSGRTMGVTAERVRQIEHKGYRKLRHPSRSILLKQLIANNPSLHLTGKNSAD